MGNETSSGPTIYLLALEPSGDVLGAKLMSALAQQTQGQAIFSGVGGELMAQQGLKTLFDASDLAILGLFEVLPKARLVFRRVDEVLADIERVQPDILVTIDSWGFTGRVHKALAQRDSPVKRVRYVAPQVWAWRPGRARQLARWIDHLLTLFPFEPALFEKHGLASTWVGHPVVEVQPDNTLGGEFRATHNIRTDETLLAVLPGSRSSEVDALCPVFAESLFQLERRFPNLRIVVPTVSNVEHRVRAWAANLPVATEVVVGAEQRWAALCASDAALAASGTITLELAIAKTPHVIAYKVNPFSAFVFKFLTKTKYVNLINVLLDQEVVPELLQQVCCPTSVMKAVSDLLENGVVRQSQLEGFEKALLRLQPTDTLPSVMAAQTVLNVIRSS